MPRKSELIKEVERLERNQEYFLGRLDKLNRKNIDLMFDVALAREELRHEKFMNNLKYGKDE